MKSLILAAMASAMGLGMGWALPAVAQPCAGDCDGNGTVAIHELVMGVQIALGTADMGQCEALDVDSDGTCRIDELILAVDSALDACEPPCPECDTDGDGLTDGLEIQVYRTSPLLADTDGDGANDMAEVLIGGRSKALLADMPDIELKLEGNPDIVLNIERLDYVEQETARLETNRQQQVNTDTLSNHMAIHNTVTLKTKTEAGTETWPPSFNAELTTESRFEHGYIHDTSSAWTNESVEETRASSKEWMTERTAWKDGSINVIIGIHNRSNLFLKMRDLSLIASRIELDRMFSTIGNLYFCIRNRVAAVIDQFFFTGLTKKLTEDFAKTDSVITTIIFNSEVTEKQIEETTESTASICTKCHRRHRWRKNSGSRQKRLQKNFKVPVVIAPTSCFD